MIQNIDIYKPNGTDIVDKCIQNNIIENWLESLDVSSNTKETYKVHLKNFIDWLNTNSIEIVSKVDILNYKQYLIKRYSNSSICLKISVLKSFYKYLEDEHITIDIAKNIKGVRIAKGFKRDIFTLEQIKSILGAIDKSTLLGKRDFALINLLLRTGLRSCEVYRANIEDIRNKDGEVVLYVQGKGHNEKDEFVVLTHTMLNILNDYLGAREKKQHITDNSPLFVSLSDRNFGEKLELYSIQWVVKNRLLDVGINSKRLTTHSTRHTAITLSLLSGVDLIDVKEMARHQNVDTTMLYVHNVNRLTKAPEKALDKIYENII